MPFDLFAHGLDAAGSHAHVDTFHDSFQNADIHHHHTTSFASTDAVPHPHHNTLASSTAYLPFFSLHIIQAYETSGTMCKNKQCFTRRSRFQIFAFIFHTEYSNCENRFADGLTCKSCGNCNQSADSDQLLLKRLACPNVPRHNTCDQLAKTESWKKMKNLIQSPNNSS